MIQTPNTIKIKTEHRAAKISALPYPIVAPGAGSIRVMHTATRAKTIPSVGVRVRG